MPDRFIFQPYWYGRFGNRMHEYAYGSTYSKINNIVFYVSSNWEGSRLFKKQYHKVVEDDRIKKFVKRFRMINDNSIGKSLKKIIPTISRISPQEDGYKHCDSPIFYADHCAYSEKIYKRMSKDFLLEVFEFSDEVKDTESYKYWENRRGTYDIAHLRRGDISNIKLNKKGKQTYSTISKDSYYNTFEKYNFNPESIIWVSDDMEKKWHKNRGSSAFFGYKYPVGSLYKRGFIFDWLNDFLAIYFARTIFRANSSFSWWASFLSPTAKIYSPVLDQLVVYGIDGKKEIDVEFVEGNHPHWMYDTCDIFIPK